MNFLPPVVLVNKQDIGDNVLLEPIADTLINTFPEVYVLGKHPHYGDIYFNHPRVKGIMSFDDIPQGSMLLDIDKTILSSELTTDIDGKIIEGVILPNKLKGMYNKCGVSYEQRRRPKLYLSFDEVQKARKFRQQYGGTCVAIVISNDNINNWPYINKLVKILLRRYYNIFIIADEILIENEELTNLNVNLLINLTIRELMWKLSAMDVVIGVDSGIMHIAGGLKIPLVVIARDIWKDLYELYDNKQILIIGNREHNDPVDYNEYIAQHPLSTISVRRIIKSVKEIVAPKIIPEKFDPERINIRPKSTDIGIFRLDGLGGTITVVDHAKKIYEETGIKSTLIIRSYKDIFKDNPYIKDVITVGSVKWGECLSQMMKQFNVIAELRFALGKWHQRKGYKIFDQDFSELDDLFAQFPMHYRELESHGLHHVQISDMNLGLPYDTIDMDIYSYEEPRVNLPDRYIIVSNGVDAIHEGMRQTKMWDGWNELTKLIDMPMVQIGTLNDMLIDDAYDMRGKTTIPQLCSIVRDASIVVCCEGGIMHLAYAVKAKNVLVLRGPTRGKLFEYPGHKFIDSYICDNCWSTTADWYAKCPKEIDAACMRSISPERVAFNIEGVLNETVV